MLLETKKTIENGKALRKSLFKTDWSASWDFRTYKLLCLVAVVVQTVHSAFVCSMLFFLTVHEYLRQQQGAEKGLGEI